MKKFLSLLLCVSLMLCVIPAMAQTADGVLRGVGKGMGGDVNVTVTVEGGKIVSVEVGAHSETPGISDPALEKLPAAIVEAQSTDVDGVASATTRLVTLVKMEFFMGLSSFCRSGKLRLLRPLPFSLRL